MKWIEENKQKLRWVILILLVLAIIGPWVFDRINVPAKYYCGPTNIRLEGDFCGSPISGIRILFWMIAGFFNMIIGLITRKIELAQTGFSFWIGFIYSLVLISLVLPIINLLFLIRRGDRPRIQKFHWVVCGLNLILVLLAGLSSFPKIYLALWGVWLYLGMMISTLILEGVLLKLPRSRNISQNTPTNIGEMENNEKWT